VGSRKPLNDPKKSLSHRAGPDEAPFDLAKAKQILATFANNTGKMRTVSRMFENRRQNVGRASKMGQRADFDATETGPSTASTHEF